MSTYLTHLYLSNYFVLEVHVFALCGTLAPHMCEAKEADNTLIALLIWLEQMQIIFFIFYVNVLCEIWFGHYINLTM
jgi:hypothetical protein